MGQIAIHGPKPYEIIGKWKSIAKILWIIGKWLSIHGFKPYEFIREIATHGPNPYAFLGELDIHGPNPYELIGKMVIHGPKPGMYMAPNPWFPWENGNGSLPPAP